MTARQHGVTTERVRVNTHRVALHTPSKELIVVENGHNAIVRTVGAVGTLPSYIGALYAYEGSGKWALGLVVSKENSDVEWFRNLEYTEFMRLVDETSKYIKRVPDDTTL